MVICEAPNKIRRDICCEREELLCRGRIPFASARIENVEKEYLGEVMLYSTPLGTYAKINVRLLEDGVYDLALVCERQRNIYLPVIYVKDGRAECAILTEKISPTQILGASLYLCRYSNGKQNQSAKGVFYLIHG